MKTYTKEELIEAQLKFNKNAAENPDGFEIYDQQDISEEKAVRQIEYLLSLIP